jgi:hypothetical protein
VQNRVRRLALARVERGGNWHKEIGRENEM